MTDIEELLARQARWQKDRRRLSWPEKIRMAEQVRSSAERLRSTAGKSPEGARKPSGAEEAQ